MQKGVYESQLRTSKKPFHMASAKLAWLIADILGLPVAFLGIYFNIDNIKSAIIAILAIGYLMLRGYYFWRQKEQAVREKELELWHKEQDKQDRIKRSQMQSTAQP